MTVIAFFIHIFLSYDICDVWWDFFFSLLVCKNGVLELGGVCIFFYYCFLSRGKIPRWLEPVYDFMMSDMIPSIIFILWFVHKNYFFEFIPSSFFAQKSWFFAFAWHVIYNSYDAPIWFDFIVRIIANFREELNQVFHNRLNSSFYISRIFVWHSYHKNLISKKLNHF